MRTLIEETPYAAVLSKPFVEKYCAFCFNSIDGNELVLACDDCVEVCYCSIKCQRKDWNAVHQLECEILRSQHSQAILTPNMRLCIRVLLQKLGKHSKNAQFEDLETNFDEFRSSSEHNKFLADLVAILHISGYSVFSNLKEKNDRKIDKNEIIGVICCVLCNSFSISDDLRGESIGSGLYLEIAKHNHSCASSSHVVFENNRAIFRTPDDQDISENLTISYISRMLPTSERQKSIKNVHFFTCQCTLCLDEQLDLIGLSARCITKGCIGGYCIRDEMCGKCGKRPIICHEEAEEATLKLLSILDHIHKHQDFDDYSKRYRHFETIRKQYAEVLSDCNLAILQIDEEITFSCGKLNKYQIPDNLENIAVRGIEHYITRLGIEAPEVTRRLLLASKCLQLLPSSPNHQNIYKQALESSQISHGSTHSITIQISKFLK